jgi:hypothetical protein
MGGNVRFGYVIEVRLSSVRRCAGAHARGWVTQTTFPSKLAESYTHDAVGVEHVDNLGAYSISSETGLLIPSDVINYRRSQWTRLPS